MNKQIWINNKEKSCISHKGISIFYTTLDENDQNYKLMFKMSNIAVISKTFIKIKEMNK